MYHIVKLWIPDVVVAKRNLKLSGWNEIWLRELEANN